MNRNPIEILVMMQNFKSTDTRRRFEEYCNGLSKAELEQLYSFSASVADFAKHRLDSLVMLDNLVTEIISRRPLDPVPVKNESENTGRRQVEYVNGERSLNHSIGEKLAPLLGLGSKEPETREGSIWVDGADNPLNPNPINPNLILQTESPLIDLAKEYTGIRVVNGTPLYQTYVYCKNAACGQRKKTFVKEWQLAVHCPACNTKHVRRDASREGFPAQDEFGNYFKADRLWIENLKSHDERIKSPVK